MFLRINMDFNECLVVSIAIFSRNLRTQNQWTLIWVGFTNLGSCNYQEMTGFCPSLLRKTASWGLSLETKNNTPTKTSNHWHVKQLIWREKHIKHHKPSVFHGLTLYEFSFERMEIPQIMYVSTTWRNPQSNQKLVLGALHIYIKPQSWKIAENRHLCITKNW